MSAFLSLSLQPVYGAQHPPLDPRRHRPLKDTPKASSVNTKSKKPATFHEFARSTNDAWDIDDEEDDGMFSLKQYSSSPVQSRSTPQTPCLKLFKSPEDTEPLPRPSDRQEPISTNHDQDGLDVESGPANGRVVKSCSDAQLNVNAARNTLQKQQSLPVRPIIPLVARISDQNASGAPPMTVREKTRLDKFKQLLASPNTDLEELRKHSWSGIPREVRPVTWRLLSGYLPANRERRDLVLQRKREEYFGFIEQYYHSRTDDNHRDTYRQIHIDIPRTNPLIPLFQQPLVQEVFERILFIWAIRHPASGYVQGINDLVTPFFVVFLSEFVEACKGAVHTVGGLTRRSMHLNELHDPNMLPAGDKRARLAPSLSRGFHPRRRDHGANASGFAGANCFACSQTQRFANFRCTVSLGRHASVAF
ncbi:TBC1 domain family member 22B [Anabarilius grahami]|uniref:TBC1 domain family member 22B n=1 Tax=Anabarilius grahami TaxID=495550 RepID=A0A3N0XJC0_ANAGA|nr:TBC1 domain family member 22B [Anabarilius grahami]